MDPAKVSKKKIQPLIKVRQAQLEIEHSRLQDLRLKKIEAVDALRLNQKKYLDGVDSLNQKRKQGNMKALLTLEGSLDSIKNSLYDNIREVRYREDEEKKQIGQVLLAQSNLKSLEKLSEQYAQQSANHQNQQEQKISDELAGQSHLRNKRI